MTAFQLRPKILTWITAFPLLVSCSGIPVTPISNAPPTPAVQVATDTPLIQNPESEIEFPGQLGFVTVPQPGKGSFDWQPASSNSQVVIFSEDAPIAPAANVRVIAPEVKAEAKFIQVSKQPYGCDGNQTTMASFSVAQALPEGIVWLASAQEADNISAVPLMEQPKTQPQQREWRAESLTIRQQVYSDYQVQTEILQQEKPLFQETSEKRVVEQVNSSPVDLYARSEVGIPQPLAVYQSGDLTLVIFWAASLEGTHFRGVVLDGTTSKSVDLAYLYYCAF
ncbi:MAG: hypothetical protein HC835_13825 [Oscillatoriales cyanobacterium RM2_1_1]|nr:hypothetical protein [Oscillatoriales cyanobacterium SM2_3_0]NJO46615.1 hypothetical protein [Oscillatoriales cyanobacterium RM2_1_1]